MNFNEYKQEVEEAMNARITANVNVHDLAQRIADIMPYSGDFNMHTMERVNKLYEMLGEAIKTARKTSDIVDYYVNAVDIQAPQVELIEVKRCDAEEW